MAGWKNSGGIFTIKLLVRCSVDSASDNSGNVGEVGHDEEDAEDMLVNEIVMSTSCGGWDVMEKGKRSLGCSARARDLWKKSARIM